MMMINRRTVCAAPIALALEAQASTRAGTDNYGGFSIDMSRSASSTREQSLASLRSQIDLVNSLRIKPEISAWFRQTRLVIDPSIRGPGEFRNGRLALKGGQTPPDDPLLLHELLHGWHFQKTPGRRRNPEILAFYAQARASGAFPAQSYMLSNVVEFYVMTASTVLWGRAARPPRTRDRV
ncbi:hypothetical protein LTR94_031966, partial [Friedmanniomyces endolithicus]